MARVFIGLTNTSIPQTLTFPGILIQMHVAGPMGVSMFNLNEWKKKDITGIYLKWQSLVS